jgi:hypothetical protein
MGNGRTARQCREHYNNSLAPAPKQWTPEEDQLLLEKQSNFGNSWAIIARFFPGRTDMAAKNRFHYLTKLATKSFESPSDEAPDRSLTNETNAALQALRDGLSANDEAPDRSLTNEAKAALQALRADLSAIVSVVDRSDKQSLRCLRKWIQMRSNTTSTVPSGDGEGRPVHHAPPLAPAALPEALYRSDLSPEAEELLDEAMKDFLRPLEDPEELLPLSLHGEPLDNAAEDFLRPLGDPEKLSLPGEPGYWDYHGA